MSLTPIMVKEALESAPKDHEFTDDQLNDMFEALYRRQPDAIDRQAGLLPLIRSAASVISS